MRLHHMRRLMISIIAGILAAGISSTGLQAELGNTVLKDRPAKVIKEVKPQFPQILKGTHFHKGAAKVVFIVDEEGNMRDFVVIATTHPVFGYAAILALKKWEIRPAVLGGQLIRSRFIANIKFRQEGIIVVQNPDEISMGTGLAKHSNKFYYRVKEIYELDYQPKRIKTVAPTFPENMKLYEHSGQALIEFYLDPKGNVLAPGILYSSNDECGYAALGAISEWKYEPPRKNGKPVFVRAEQPFYFKFVEPPPAQLEDKGLLPKAG